MKLEPIHLRQFKGVLDSNIVKMIDDRITSQQIVIVYEYFSFSLDEVFREYSNGMPERLANRLLLQLSNALQHLHSKDLIHRNIKMDSLKLKVDKHAENAFRNRQLDANAILQQASLRLFGFQVSKQALVATTITGCTSTMAPEIDRGLQYTQSVDIYSAGVIYNWLVTGENINLGISDRFSTNNNRQSSQSRQLTEKMLSYDPSQRPTAAELYRTFSQMVQKQDSQDASEQQSPLGNIPRKQALRTYIPLRKGIQSHSLNSNQQHPSTKQSKVDFSFDEPEVNLQFQQELFSPPNQIDPVDIVASSTPKLRVIYSFAEPNGAINQSLLEDLQKHNHMQMKFSTRLIAHFIHKIQNYQGVPRKVYKGYLLLKKCYDLIQATFLRRGIREPILKTLLKLALYDAKELESQLSPQQLQERLVNGRPITNDIMKDIREDIRSFQTQVPPARNSFLMFFSLCGLCKNDDSSGEVVSVNDLQRLKDRLIQELITLTAQETLCIRLDNSPYLESLAAILWVLIHKQLIDINFTLPEILALRQKEKIEQKKCIYNQLLRCHILMERNVFETWVREQA